MSLKERKTLWLNNILDYNKVINAYDNNSWLKCSMMICSVFNNHRDGEFIIPLSNESKPSVMSTGQNIKNASECSYLC